MYILRKIFFNYKETFNALKWYFWNALGSGKFTKKGEKELSDYFLPVEEKCAYTYFYVRALIHSRHWMLNLIWKLLEITTHLRNIGSIGI